MRWPLSSHWWNRVRAWPTRSPGSPPARECRGGWSASMRARTSRCSSTTRTSRARSRRCCRPCARSLRAASRSFWAAAATSLADTAILTNDNPRSEDPLAILAEMMSGALTVPAARRAHVIVEPDRAAAIGLAVARAGKGDVVVIAGKGHEKGQYVGATLIPFDDREVAAEALSGRSWPGAGALDDPLAPGPGDPPAPGLGAGRDELP